jgi:diadenosine tetraphosphate (Ap4A) HIT family hydrolase
MSFTLHPRLAADTIFVEDWALSRVLLMNDARYRWLVLVPRVADVSEVFDLLPADRATLNDETSRAAQMLKRLTACAKINIGALGNLVPQLHVHIVARNPGDPAWPGPVWGHSAAVPYDDAVRAAFVAELVKAR